MASRQFLHARTCPATGHRETGWYSGEDPKWTGIITIRTLISGHLAASLSEGWVDAEDELAVADAHPAGARPFARKTISTSSTRWLTELSATANATVSIPCSACRLRANNWTGCITLDAAFWIAARDNEVFWSVRQKDRRGKTGRIPRGAGDGRLLPVSRRAYADRVASNRGAGPGGLYLRFDAVGGARPAGYRADDTDRVSQRGHQTRVRAGADRYRCWIGEQIGAAQSRSSKSWVWRAAIRKTRSTRSTAYLDNKSIVPVAE